MEIHHPIRCIADVACLGGIVTSAFGYLPTIAAVAASVLAAVWYGVCLYDRLKKEKPHD